MSDLNLVLLIVIILLLLGVDGMLEWLFTMALISAGIVGIVWLYSQVIS